MEFKKVTADNLKVALEESAILLKRAEVVLEKDYWLCFVLDYIFNKSLWKNAFTFKGGISLSKCFNLIERFSEDIDLILDWKVLGYQKEDFLLERSNVQQDKFNKSTVPRIEEWLENVFIPQLQDDLNKLTNQKLEISLDQSMKQSVLIKYPNFFNSLYIKNYIRLKIGILSEDEPFVIAKIKPDIYDKFPMLFEGDGFEVRTIKPERTFWEKATILHHEANRPQNSKFPIRYARHYYDLYRIANSEYKSSLFDHLSLLRRIALFKNKLYPQRWAQYEEIAQQTLKLIPKSYRWNEISRDYYEMIEMLYGEIPDFNEMLKALIELEKEIREYKKQD
ncbi:Nucleotidyl transferase of uncharacterised function (DUF1814) [Mycoplasmopsis californica]|uniref:Nucleotidyl transferase AbiEii/AbiGii toxin family protein n=1 Tax=Mycoplasmopsis equigenitalium TaxID=114883 RepID=A0ABY5J0B4_9BACT|nr:nucleotidyl transferase AbiEii/AbiGii toxin family protein [Mycoplasmopsis equigenitalium]UUD36702.1 nucleotidyl transferase AbiEii/AbiGii toxin family protein [Mycoplasmopsis equigenitalium]VEU70005.1 Nucleotidyl transferase of uncharacterised function (DUF1814) [Mycoplasmopsis californica]